MTNMIKKLLGFVLCVVLLPTFVAAQDFTSVKTQLNAMFSGLEKSRVPTGFLWDTAVNLIEAEDYNGLSLTDSNYVDMSRLYDMIRSINSASVWADTLDVGAAISGIQNNSSENNAKLGFLFKPYNRIVSTALQNNLINYNNGLVSDKYENSVWINPYEDCILFGCAVDNDGVVSQFVNYTIKSIDSLSVHIDYGFGLCNNRRE